MVGASGGEFGIRGFVAAFDPDTGKELWRTYTVPAPGEPGSETWPRAISGRPAARRSGSPATTIPTPTWRTGAPATAARGWATSARATISIPTSTIALDVATGAIKGHFQYHPNDSWDWDEVSPPILVDYRRNGRTIKGLIDVARDGYLWFLERSAGPDPLRRRQAVRESERVREPRSRRPDGPTSIPRASLAPESARISARTLHGGKNWPPIAFSPQDADDLHPGQQQPVRIDTWASMSSTRRAGLSSACSGSRPSTAPGADHFGEVQAWNVDTGQKVWTHNYAKSPELGIDAGHRAAGWCSPEAPTIARFHAFDASTGKLLWEFPTNSGILAPPTSFAIDGKQYIAVESGWGGDSRGMQATLNRLFPGEYPRGARKAAPSGCLRSSSVSLGRLTRR